jgi:acetyl-CoA acyltransferase 1
MLLMKRSTAEILKLPIAGVFRAFVVKGCDPKIMGIGPAIAIPGNFF